jgi:predicted ATPase
VAYNSVLIDRRRVLHRRTAEALEALFGGNSSDHLDDLAHHYSRAGDADKASDYLGRAGQQAIQRSAYAEAIDHLNAALDLLKTLPDTPEHVRREFTLQIALGAALIATKGWAAPEVESVYTQARGLCQRVGETPQLVPVLWGLWAYYVVRAEYGMAYELAEQLFTFGQRLHDSALLAVAHDALGGTLISFGECSSARYHFEQSLALYDLLQHGSLAFLMGGEELGVVCRIRLAVTLWFLGYPAQGLQRLQEALTLAQELKSPFNFAFALLWAAVLHHFRRELRLTQERAEACVAL